MSTLKVDNFQSSSGRSVAVCFGQAAFNAVAFAIGGSTNCSSISDNATGKFQFNYASTVPNANYSIAGTVSYSGGTWTCVHGHGNSGTFYTPTTSNFRWDQVSYNGSGYYDGTRCDISAMGS